MNDLRLLGLKVRDKVTGLTGVCESIAYDLYGCIQAVVRPPANEKGDLVEGRWIDVSRLDVLDETPVMAIPGGRFDVQRDTSGPAEKPYR